VRQRSAGSLVFDASAVLALLQGERGSEKLLSVQADAVVSSVNAAEVVAKLVSRGMPERQAQAAFDALHLEIVSFDAVLAGLSARYVGRGVSLGDRCFLATAEQFGPGWTSDRDLATLAGDRLPKLNFFR
jgi:ribonuclease VapC